MIALRWNAYFENVLSPSISNITREFLKIFALMQDIRAKAISLKRMG